MNVKLNIGSFAMRLSSPSSTSKQLSVAIKFSGPTGVVFTFDNSGSLQYSLLRCFNCSYLSCFPEEDERLFFGGFYRIKVVTLRMIATKENMNKFVSAICEFDKALNGDCASKKVKKVFFVIDTLINILLKKETKKVIFPPFIVDCFQAFAENKKQIVFNMFDLFNYGNAKINKLLFHSVENNKEIKRDVDDLSNVICAELFALFPNVRKLIIQSTGGPVSFSLSLLALLNVICGTNLNEIVVKTTKYYGHSTTWMKKVWNSDEAMLKEEYAAKGYQIEMETYTEMNGTTQYNLKINKL